MTKRRAKMKSQKINFGCTNNNFVYSKVKIPNKEKGRGKIAKKERGEVKFPIKRREGVKFLMVR